MPEATPVPAPVAPKKRSKVPFVIAAVVVFGLLALVAGGFAIYQFVYLPHTAREFVAATESKSKEANAKGQEILAEINVFYSDKEIELVDSQDAITAFEQKNAELKQLVDEQAQGLPAASPATAELRNALEAYYQAHDEFSHVYTHYNEYLQALIPPLNNTLTALTDGTLNLQVNTLADIDTAISVYTAKASEFNAIIGQIPVVEEPEMYPAQVELNAAYKILLEASVKFFNDAAGLLQEMKAGALAGSQSRINAAVAQVTTLMADYQVVATKFDTDAQAALNEKGLAQLVEAFEKAETAYDQVEAKYAELKSKYGI